MFQKILVAVDESAISQRAFRAALTLAKQTNAQLKLVHVLSPIEERFASPVFPYESTYPGASAEEFQLSIQLWQELQQQGTEFLRSLTEKAAATGVQAEASQPLGNPGRVICEVAEEWGANLIVLGRREHTRLDELIAGSVSNYVLHHAASSVLTVFGEPLI